MIKTRALLYLGINKPFVNDEIDSMIDICIQEVKEISEVKIFVKQFSKKDSFYIQNESLFTSSKTVSTAFKDCSEIIIMAGTLGLAIDRKIKYYQVLDLHKAVLFDAVASSYLEYVCDEKEASLSLGVHTFRYAPGYGDIGLALNRSIRDYYDLQKEIGVCVSAHDLLIPMKSMIGLIGIGATSRKSCDDCQLFDACIIRKKGEACYIKN